MSASLSGVFNCQEFTDLGALAAGYRLYTYAAATTTQKTAFTDAAGTIPHTYTSDGIGGQYIALNARGEIPAPLFLAPDAYDIALKTPAGATVWTRRAQGGSDAAAALDTALRYDLASTTDTSKGSRFIGWLLNATGAIGRWLSDRLSDSVSSKDFGAAGDFNLAAGTGTDDTAAIQAAWTWCATNGRRLKQVGVSKITAPLTYPVGGQLEVVGAGAVRTYDSGYAYRGTGTMLTGAGADKTLAFVNFRNLVFDGPGIGSGVDGLYGDFYQGGAAGCIFRNWRRAVESFGSLNTFKHNRFLSNVEGLVVTNWPLTSSQPGESTTTFISRRNNFFGNTGFGLKVDTSGTGGNNVVSSGSFDDVFEQNGVGFYLNKSFDFTVVNDHYEQHVTWAKQWIDSNPTVINEYVSPSDAAKVSVTFPGAAANAAGLTQIGYDGTKTRALVLTTKGINTAAFVANDAGTVDMVGAGLTGTWTPAVGSTGGTTAGNTYSKQEGYFFRLGKFVFCPFAIYMTAKDAGMTGNVRVTGLPFSVGTQFNGFGNALRFANLTLNGGAYTALMADATTGTSIADLVKCGSGLAALNVGAADISATSRISGTIIYMVD